MASPRGDPDSTPICRCRVLYLGSAVPHVTKDGLQGIQEPLRELYPEQGALGARGIDSWLSVWSNGLLLENVDENHKKVTRFFPIETLHYCAAVRYVLVPEKAGTGSPSSTPATPRFLPLDSPFARSPNPSHPPLFAAILRRTTGIKVLECHAFICKREMAANALVRCCFHAYADSSYARHIDGGSTSVYGTLRSQNNGASPLMTSNSIEKVEGWRQMARGGNSGSTLTLNSHHHHHQQNNNNNNNGTLTSNATADNISTADDLSIYNGDENHKVWAGAGGSPSEREEFYGGVNTMRSARSNRPRQMVAPVTSPPPPPTPSTSKDEKNNKKASKDKARRKKMMGGSREELYPLMNGSLMRGATMQAHHHHHGNMRSSSSLSGTLMRNAGGHGHHHYSNGSLLRPQSAHQMNGYHHPAQPPPVLLVPHPTSTLPPGRHHHVPKRMVAGTFSHRPPQIKGNVMVAPAPLLPVIPPNMIAAAPPMIPIGPPPTTGKKSSKHHHHPVAVEEPIYMPSARPMSPVASFQPGHFPHEAYLMQQYANTTMESKHKKKPKGEKNKQHPQQQPPAMMNGGAIPPVTPVVMVTDEDDEGPPTPAIVEESPFNTGIYRKKGHLNERAFSYSIRQEHRSRSYGSLASLKFATPIPNGGPPKEDLKKEREIMQMMHDLELSGDELERSEVPAAVYESRRAAATAASGGGGVRR